MTLLTDVVKVCKQVTKDSDSSQARESAPLMLLYGPRDAGCGGHSAEEARGPGINMNSLLEGNIYVKPASVALLGAYGHTGRFVAAEFRRRGWSPILCGRDAHKLDALQPLFPGLETRVAAADDPDSLDRAVESVGAIVNCAGPFLDTGIPVVQAALRAGVHYLDITAEQEVARRCFEMFDAPAKQRGITVIPAMGFYGGLADLLATWVMGDWPRADAITVVTALSSWHPTAGTRLTGARNTFPRVVVEDGKLAALPLPPPKCEWRFPEPFGLQHMTAVPLSEIITMHQHLQCAEVMSYLNDQSLSDLRDPAAPTPQPVDAQGRSAQRFSMMVQVCCGDRQRSSHASGQDIYAVTAPLVVEATERLLRRTSPLAGVHAPGGMFDAGDFLSALEPVFSALERTSAAPRRDLR